LDLYAVITELDWKTWGFSVYPDDYDEQANPFEHQMKCILLEGIMPLASMYFAGFFSARGIAHQACCQPDTDSVCLIGI
jgi:hypothetical protein